MSYDVAFRFQQALDPSALTTIPGALHGITAAIDDCRRAGKATDSDPAVLLLVPLPRPARLYRRAQPPRRHARTEQRRRAGAAHLPRSVADSPDVRRPFGRLIA